MPRGHHRYGWKSEEITAQSRPQKRRCAACKSPITAFPCLHVALAPLAGRWCPTKSLNNARRGLDRKVVQVGPACRAGHGVIQDTTRGLELQPEPVCPLLDRLTIKAARRLQNRGFSQRRAPSVVHEQGRFVGHPQGVYVLIQPVPLQREHLPCRMVVARSSGRCRQSNRASRRGNSESRDGTAISQFSTQRGRREPSVWRPCRHIPLISNAVEFLTLFSRPTGAGRGGPERQLGVGWRPCPPWNTSSFARATSLAKLP